jgi:AcrR family transcriptional regulator
MATVNSGPRAAQARAAQAQATRELIVDTASSLFQTRGYRSTSITTIAAGAGVVVQTIYNAVGNKAALLNAVLDRTVSGPNAPATVPEFMRQRMAATTDAASAVAVLADWLAEVNLRADEVFGVIRQAAAIDPEIAEFERRRSLQRLEHYGEAAQALRARGALGDATSDEQAAAAIFAIGHPDIHRSLTRDAGWSDADYRAWLDTSLTAALTVPR